MIQRVTRIGAFARLPLLFDPLVYQRMPEADRDKRIDLFNEALDSGLLGIDMTDVTHVTVRVLDGAAPADATLSVMRRGKVSPDDQIGFGTAVQMEMARRCIVHIDGDPAAPVVEEDGVERYPLASMLSMPTVALAAAALRYQTTLGTLGEWPASLCAPQSDAMQSEGAAATRSSTARAATASRPKRGTGDGSRKAG